MQKSLPPAQFSHSQGSSLAHEDVQWRLPEGDWAQILVKHALQSSSSKQFVGATQTHQHPASTLGTVPDVQSGAGSEQVVPMQAMPWKPEACVPWREANHAASSSEPGVGGAHV